MALPTKRRLAVVLAGALLFTALVASSAEGESAQRPKALGRAVDAGPAMEFRAARLTGDVMAYRGGPTTTSTGETVDVRISDALPDTVTPQYWAEFLAHLTHGPELAQLTVYILTLDEMQQVCGTQALGCYASDQLVALGETEFDTTPEEVVRHEYGHHIAYHRMNPPWSAIDWGPKRWASALDVCSRVARSEAYPGNESTNYALNPGEAWAETYRILQERKAGITTGSWPIVSSTFFPNDAALAAAEQDVVQPWTRPRATSFTRTYGQKTPRVWWIRITTPLDGDMRVSTAVPNGGSVDVSLVGSDRKTVVRRAQWVSQRVKRLNGSVCGQRSLFVRVTENGLRGRVRVSVTTP